MTFEDAIKNRKEIDRLFKYVQSLPPEEAKKEAIRIMEEYKAKYIKELEKQIEIYNKGVK